MSSTTYRPGDGMQPFVNTIPPEVRPGPAIQGTGSPEGAVDANPGTAFVDQATNNLYVKFAGVQKLGWQLVGKYLAGSSGGSTGESGGVTRVFAGTGSPVDVIYPSDESAILYTQTDSVPPGLIWQYYDGAWH
jgi:hypothetical protein